MQHKLLTLLFCVVLGIVAVHGRSQIRLMNARYYSGQIIGVTTSPYLTNLTMTVQGRFDVMLNIIPATSYIQLPAASIPLNSRVNFLAYDGDDRNVPVQIFANRSATLGESQSYSLVYVDQTDTDYVSSFTEVPPQLFIFEELNGHSGASLKIVNVAVSSYPYGNIRVSLNGYYDYYVPYGGDSGFLGVAEGPLNITAYLASGQQTIQIYIRNLTTILYLRGDLDPELAGFGYNLVEHNWEDFAPATPTPIAAPVEAPYDPSTPIAPISNTSMIKFINNFDPYNSYYNLEMYHYQYGSYSYNITTNFVSDYQVVYAGQHYLFVREVSSTDVNIEAGTNYTVYMNGNYYMNVLRDTPQYFNQTANYLRIVNNVPGYTYLQLYTDSNGWEQWQSSTGDIWNEDFRQMTGTYAQLYASGNQTSTTFFYLNAGYATTVYLYSYQGNIYFFVDERPLSAPTGPACANGYVEDNGACNCYAGYTTDNSSPYKCAVSAPYYCFQNQTDALSNDVVPYIPYWNTQVYGNQLYFTVNSAIVSGRRTLIELPNSQCSFINSPQYYQKYNSGCEDSIAVSIPFISCGFVKTTSSSSEDVYKGTVHVKQIDRVTVAGTTYDRVIDTPMPIAIRLPKTLAIESYVQVFGPPSLAIDAAFVGQTVSTESQSGNLQYVSAVQYPLQIAAVELVDLPNGVNAWIEVVNVNCTDFGPCVQRLEVHLNTTSCSISGVYRMVVSLNCRSDQGCPEEAKNGTQVFIESRIVSQSLCGEVSVDIDLNGNIQAFTDQSFSNYALAFYPGQSAYFLITAYSSRVNLTRVSVQSVYYYGPNVNYQYLSYNTSLSNIAIANNFTTGSVGYNQAWFGIDVSVSTPNSGDNSTLFKLYQGQNGVYNFVAVVDVEWFVENTPSTTPVAPGNPNSPSSFKKRMTLQGSVSNQGSQFTAQVQVAGPTPSSQQPQQQQQTPVAANPGTTGSDPVSSSVALSSSVLVMVVVAFIALF